MCADSVSLRGVSRAVSIALPRDAKMTDVPCHSWIMPTLLRHAGIEFLHLGCNAASRSPQVPLLFWWEGPDGSRLLTMYAAEGYGTGLAPPADWPYRTWLALIAHRRQSRSAETGRSVAVAGPSTDPVPRRQGAHRSPIGFCRRAACREGPSIPVVRGDMPDSWIHGPMCNPQGARLARNIRPQTRDRRVAQYAAAAVGCAAPRTLRRRSLPRTRQSLLYGEHTWGGALAWVSRTTGRWP